MRFLLITVGILTTSIVFGQVKRQYLYKQKIGTIDCSYTMETESNDTSTYISLLFQNQKYRNVSDIKVISLSIGANVSDYEETKEGNKIIGPYLEDLKFLKGFLKDLGEAYGEMGKKMNLEWKDKILARYTVTLYDFDNLLYLEKDRGYTAINKAQAKVLIDWLSQFNKETIQTPVLIINKEKVDVQF